MKHLLSVLAFVVVTFAVQGLSHFILNAEHYAAITHLRPEPIMPLGFITMIVQAAILSFAMTQYRPASTGIRKGLEVSLLFGGFLACYIVLTEPAKYMVPSIREWIVVEATASSVQFLIFGVLIGLIHKTFK